MKNYLLIIFFLFLSTTTYGAQKAYVVVDEALIYADITLKAPIGKISRGQEVMVGSVARRSGTVLPIAISGRIAWIDIDDLSFDPVLNFEPFSAQYSEHNIETQFQTAMDKLTANIHFAVSYGTTELSDGWLDFMEDVGSTAASKSIEQFRLTFEYRPPDGWYHWGVGLNYLSTPNHRGQLQYRGLYGEFFVSRILLRTSLISLEAQANLLLSGSTEFVVNTIDVFFTDKKPSWGYRFGGGAKLFPFSKIGFFGGIYYETLSLGSYGDIQGRDRSFDPGDLVGISLNFGLSYRL